MFDLDYETITVIVQLIKKNEHPNLIIGYFESNNAIRLDQNGIQWEWDPVKKEKIILRFFYCKDFEFIELNDDFKEHNPKIESSIPFKQIQSVEINSSDIFLKKCSDLKRAFLLFGFTQVLYDGMLLIKYAEQSNDNLEGITHALGEVYALVALSAHNRQFTSKGHHVLAEFIEKNLIQALKFDLEPELRAATLYRLAVLYGRRKKKFHKSISTCNEMIDFIENATIIKSEYFYQLGWAYNIKAYNNQLTKNVKNAKEDIDKSQKYFEKLKHFIATNDDSTKAIWMRDTLKSITLPLFNKSRTLTEKNEKNIQNFKIFKFFEENDLIDLNEADNKLLYYKSNHNLVDAIKWARIGVQRSVQNHRAFKEQFFRFELADLYYKYGDVNAAMEEVKTIEENYFRFKIVSSMPNLDLSMIMIKIRASAFKTSLRLLTDYINHSKDFQVLSELYAMRYLTSVMAKIESEFNEDKESAINLATKTGNASIMIRVISLIGDALLENGDIDNLKDAYKNGVEIIDYGKKNGITLPPEHALKILVGYQELFGFNKERMQFIDQNLASMLYVSESWWVIPRILKLVKNKYSLSKKSNSIITQRIEVFENSSLPC